MKSFPFWLNCFFTTKDRYSASASLQMQNQSTYRCPTTFSLIREQDSKILKLLHLRQDLFPNPEKALCHFLAQDSWLWRHWSSSRPLHSLLWTTLAKVVDPSLIKSVAPHHLQRAEMRSTLAATGLCPLKLGTELVTKGNPNKGQLSPKTSWTSCWQCRRDAWASSADSFQCG